MMPDGASGGLDHAAILDAVDGLILRIDAGAAVAYASAGARALLGRDPAALTGSPLAALLHPEDGAALAALLARREPARAAGLRLRTGRGGFVPVVVALSPASGTGWRVATIRPLPDAGRPADRPEEARAGLRMSGDYYRVLADTLPQLIWMERADTGETIYANSAFAEYCGALPPSREARTDRFHPEDAPRIAAACAQARDGSCEVQARVRGRACGYRWHQLVFRPLRRDGQLLGWLGSALDIDEIVIARKALEETGDLLRLAQEAAGAGLFDINLGTRDMILSPESARRHGLPGDRPAVIGLAHWMRRIVPQDRAPTLRAVRAALAARRTFDVAFRVSAGAGARRWIQAIGRPYHDAEGVARRLTGLTLDITSRMDTERALVEATSAAEAARAQAERANAAKTDFLSAMSHEIRTPLNAVIGFAHLLAESGRLEGDLRRYADLARIAGESLRTVVDDILDFAAVESGRIGLCTEPFALRELLDTCLGIVGTAAADKGLTMSLVVEEAVPDGLVGDAGRLRQILLNLLNNAVKFTRTGSISVGLSHGGRTPAGELIGFSVSDTGIGIAPDQQGRLFERFHQADSSIRRDFGGTGLGLAISRQLVERMGGTIGLVSEVGQGSTFSFTLILPRADAARPDLPRVPAGAARTGRILLVEDFELNRELACTVLRSAGHTVDVAVDGLSAVRAVADGAYDLVLMDIQMPGIDGMTATRLIRALPGPAAAVPVVAMTANVLPDQIRAFAEAGMDGHVAKPFQPAELRAAVERWLGGAAPVPTAASDEPAPTLDRARHAENLALLTPETLTRLLRHFRAELADAFTAPDRPALRREAHTLASAAGLLGFAALSQACLALESADEAALPARLAEARRLAAVAADEAAALLATTEPAPPPHEGSPG